MNKALQHEQGRYRPFTAFSGLPAGTKPLPDDNWPYLHRPISGDDPQYGIKAPKFQRHIFIRRDQLLFDIDAQLAMMAEGRKNEDGTQDDTITNATDKYQSMFYRWIDRHIGEAKTIMSAMVLEKFTETAMDSIKDTEEVDITLLMPQWYDDTTFLQLCNVVHDFVVNATMAEYCKLRFSSKDPMTADKMQDAEYGKSEIRKLVNMSKPGLISKPFKPF